MIELKIGESREQAAIGALPYDRWVVPGGEVSAQFFRRPSGMMVRFPAQVDFVISPESGKVEAYPEAATSHEAVRTLFTNAIKPMLRNHAGGLNLHGSAVGIGSGAAAFLGISRSGKTTLAGALAKLGHPFLTEDVVELELAQGGYMVQPCRPVLRLFDDSASFLLDRDQEGARSKQAVDASAALPYAEEPCQLSAIFLLGPGSAEDVAINKLHPAMALAQLMQHSFILDCEDRNRLKGHFERLASLSGALQCFSLDYPRQYATLPKVRDAILQAMDESE